MALLGGGALVAHLLVACALTLMLTGLDRLLALACAVGRRIARLLARGAAAPAPGVLPAPAPPAPAVIARGTRRPRGPPVPAVA